MEERETDKTEDRRIQQWLEKDLPGFVSKGNSSQEDTKDTKMYQLVFEALKEEPAAGLPLNFSVKMEWLVIQQKQKSRQNLLYALLTIACLLVLVGSLLIWQDSLTATKWIATLNSYKMPLMFGMGMLIVMQFLDNKYVIKERWLQSLMKDNTKR